MAQVEAIIGQAEADGVHLCLSDRGGVKVHGDRVAVERWLPILRQHKVYLLDGPDDIQDTEAQCGSNRRTSSC